MLDFHRCTACRRDGCDGTHHHARRPRGVTARLLTCLSRSGRRRLSTHLAPSSANRRPSLLGLCQARDAIGGGCVRGRSAVLGSAPRRGEGVQQCGPESAAAACPSEQATQAALCSMLCAAGGPRADVVQAYQNRAACGTSTETPADVCCSPCHALQHYSASGPHVKLRYTPVATSIETCDSACVTLHGQDHCIVFSQKYAMGRIATSTDPSYKGHRSCTMGSCRGEAYHANVQTARTEAHAGR